MTTLPFYIFLFIHLVSLVTGFGAVIVIDSIGMLWVLKRVPLSFVNRAAGITQRLIWLGWSGLVLSGIGLIIIKGYVDNLTKIKLALVAMIGINGILLHTIKRAMEKLADGDAMPRNTQFRITFASAVSQLGWWGALAIGFVHRHWRHDIPWPSHPWYFVSGLSVFLIVVFFIGNAVTRTRNL